MFDKMQTRLKLEFNKKKNNKLLQKKKGYASPIHIQYD